MGTEQFGVTLRLYVPIRDDCSASIVWVNDTLAVVFVVFINI
jgi:hypothetical protein